MNVRNTATTDTASSSEVGGRPHAVPLRAVELFLVVVAWTFYGLLHVATGILDARPGGPPSGPRPSDVAVDLLNAVVWAAITIFVLWLSRHVPLDRAFWRRRGVLVLALGVLVANVADLLSDASWDALFPPAPAGMEGRAHRRFNPGLDNLTWLDDLGVFVAAVAVAAARAYVLRERARREESRRREAELEARSARTQAEAAQLQADASRLQAQLVEARLDALRRQLDPHFLFNTLNAVSALVERDPRGVRRMIGQLSDLLRHSMAGASASEVPLRQELALLERYVDIMRVRFEDQLEIEARVDPRTLDALVPNLILQPLVENAIKHGVEQRDDGGRVEIEAGLDGDVLVLRVRDDGPGMAPWTGQAGAAPAEAPAMNGAGNGPGEGRGSVGLPNTAERLHQLYGADHGFTVGPGPGGGTIAEVRLPYRTTAGVRPVARTADPAPLAHREDARVG